MPHRPFEQLTREELGEEFAACARMGGRPVVRAGEQIAYADLAMELLLQEFRWRDGESRRAWEEEQEARAEPDRYDAEALRLYAPPGDAA